MPKLRDVYGEAERLQKRREAVLESSKELDRLTRELHDEPAEEGTDPRAVVDAALQDLTKPSTA